jgi:hypothetical protein
MEVQALVKVNGVGEREHDGRVYRSVNLFFEGKDADSLKVSIPKGSNGLAQQAAQCVDKRCKAILNLRQYKGELHVDLVSLEVVNGTPATPPAKS